jgi:hypothetical protein
VRIARCRSAGSASFSEWPVRACIGRLRLRHDLALTRQIDELFARGLFLGSRRMSRML